ncbi:amino acid adenylation domain-containing protein [Corallococcus carmarthensis]|uniref:amino acid adenylation domain-containing protein n=1 Tax=Corallococcus carmarthensis TaxID=2316728 RepID=UPI00148E08E0|nr:amino acid adenylation domain-containing protein [Corallococcus carmarthensis]NOK15685.1 amino acid adenylation domain-containing protein [Corallococcus carmarthensis]
MQRPNAQSVRPLAETFAHIAAARGDHPAVVGPREAVSYAALQRSVVSLSGGLVSRGLEGAVIAMLLPSDLAYVATMLSILDRRGVFAPMDAAWPEARLRSALEMTRPAALVVTPEQAERVSGLVATLGSPCELLVVEGRAAEGFRFNTVRAAPEVPQRHNDLTAPWTEDSLYLVYTSGSTGTPNAVEGSHLSLAVFIEWQARTFEVGPECRVSQLAPTTFDVSLRDFFLPLCTGGTLYIPAAGTRYHPILFPRWVAEHRINLMHSVPSVFKLASEVSWTNAKLKGSFDSLRKLFLSGERLYVEDARQLQAHLSPDAQLINFYGPSECTLIKTCFVVPRDCSGLEGDVVPLGRPIEGCEVRLDGGPDAQSGELVLESEFLAKGYYRNPELTAAKFSRVARPDAPRLRAYRTGDLGYRDGQGLLHFTGRKDHQIKVNGNRVELGEVEHCLRRMPGVSGAVVVASDSRQGADPILSCVYASDGDLAEDQVRAHLLQHLPKYMVPTNVRRMGELPLLTNGKVDRKQIASLF